MWLNNFWRNVWEVKSLEWNSRLLARTAQTQLLPERQPSVRFCSACEFRWVHSGSTVARQKVLRGVHSSRTRQIGPMKLGLNFNRTQLESLLSGWLIVGLAFPRAVEHLLERGLHHFATAGLIADMDIFDNIALSNNHGMWNA